MMLDVATLTQICAFVLTIPDDLLAHDPLLRERVRAVKALVAELSKTPVDIGECNRLADRLLQIVNSPAPPASVN